MQKDAKGKQSGDATDPVFPIVGIGASAGGLAVLKSFFNATPRGCGMAFVLIQHLDPNHKSLMVDLLGSCTAMQVLQIEDGMRVERNHIYVSPPNRDVRIQGGVLHLSEPVEKRGLRMPINGFLNSLAEDQQERAICIILSGTGSDGTIGLKAIKAYGGMAMVQEPRTAQYNGMPLSAISTGMVDFVMPVETMPEVLINYAKHPYVSGEPGSAVLSPEALDGINAILALLRIRQGIDFSLYKRTTIARRIERRMSLNRIEELSDYLTLLLTQPEEIERLRKDLMIKVTSFFRDGDCFTALREKVLRPWVEKAAAGATLRIWVPACATGDEAYSIAMLALDQMEKQHKSVELKVFASDIDEDALKTAREGVFPANIASDIPAELLNRYFTKCLDHRYEVSPALRESIVFAQHNLTTDPPFSRLDLLSCRNLLIYLLPEVQDKLISLFHFALKPDGFLLLGSAESIGRHEDLFEPVSKKWRIYRRLETVGTHLVELPALSQGKSLEVVRTATPSAPPQAPRGLVSGAPGWILEEYAPPTVIINRKCESLYFSGDVDRYLNVPVGEPNLNLLDMLREGLSTRVRHAVQRAFREDRLIEIGGARIKRGGRYETVNVRVKPIKSRHSPNGLWMVSFLKAPRQGQVLREQETQGAEHTVCLLEEELKFAREDLQGSIKELEISNAELRIVNEDAMSANEELQSANEELETSKEELQSANEELYRLNNQLQDNIKELEQAKNDLFNLLACTHVATLFLDTRLRIKKFTPASTALFNLIASDLGRPFSDIAQKMTDPHLLADVKKVLKTLAVVERNVRDGKGRYFLRRTLPYRTENNRVDGVVVTFVDVTELKRSEQQARLSLAELESVYHNAPIGLALIDPQLRFVRVNEILAEFNGLPAADMIGRTVREVIGDPLADEIEPQLREVLANEEAIIQFETTGSVAQRPGEELFWSCHFSLLKPPDGEAVGINMALQDITERKRAERRLATEHAVARVLAEAATFEEASPRILEAFIDTLGAAICELWLPEADGERLTCRAFCASKVLGKGQAVRESFDALLFQHRQAFVEKVWQDKKTLWLTDIGKNPHFSRFNEAMKLCLVSAFAFPILAGHDCVGVMSFFIRRRKQPDASVLGMLETIGRQIGEFARRTQVEAAIRQSEQRFRLMADAIPEVIFTTIPEGACDFANARFCELTGLTFEQVIGYGWMKALHTEDRQRKLDQWQRSVRTGEPFEARYRFRLADGEYRWYLGRARPVRDEKGNITAWFGSATDIHDLVLAEQALREAARQKNEFITLLAHELRNPLAPLRSIVDLLQRTHGQELDLQDKIAVINRQVRHMARMLDDLLDVGRIVRGRIQLAKETVDLVALIRSTTEDFRSALEQCGLTFKVNLPDQPLWIDADPTRIAQVIGNLLQNAMKFTRAGDRVSVDAAQDGNTPYVLMSVSDTGVGMDAKTLESAFEVFQQVDQGLDRSRGGLGLGLPLAKGLVELHQGEISAASDGVGSGSKFTVRLPLSQAPSLKRKPHSSSASPPKRVLVIDDSRDTADALGELLKLVGHEVVIAYNGVQGIETAQRFLPDVVLCDIGLPGEMDGYATARAMRQDPKLASAFLIAITGYGQEKDKKQAIEAGFDMHFTKPVQFEELVRIVSTDTGRASSKNCAR